MAIESDARRAPTPYKPPLVSFEDFHDWLKKNQRAEWVDGEVIEPARDNLAHHLLVGFLLCLLKRYTDHRRPGDVFLSVFLMRLLHRPSARMPDVFFVAGEHRERLKDTFCDALAVRV